MNTAEIQDIIVKTSVGKDLQSIADKVFQEERITCDEALKLYEKADLNFVGLLANFVKTKKFGSSVFFNKNIHV
ncbi:MAG: hypothetical protein IKR66_07945 [Bacteroidales bacterium]|nr:hypothetical protein [Bacteroidales bacterium]